MVQCCVQISDYSSNTKTVTRSKTRKSQEMTSRDAISMATGVIAMVLSYFM